MIEGILIGLTTALTLKYFYGNDWLFFWNNYWNTTGLGQ